MLYFLHNYELPAIENGSDNGRRDEDAYLDEAVQMIVEGIEMVAGQQNNLHHGENAEGEVENSPNDSVHTPTTNEVNEEEAAGEAHEPLDYMVHRVILFAADTSLLQIFREFIRIILGHINRDGRNSDVVEHLPNNEQTLSVVRNDDINNDTAQHVEMNDDSENDDVENYNEESCVERDVVQTLSNDSVMPHVDNYLQIHDTPLLSKSEEEEEGSEYVPINLELSTCTLPSPSSDTHQMNLVNNENKNCNMDTNGVSNSYSDGLLEFNIDDMVDNEPR